MTISEHMDQVKEEVKNPVSEIPAEAVIPMPVKTEKDEEKPKKNVGGRPKKEINKDEFEELCKIQCTEKEITAVFGCTDKTLTRWCKDTYGKGFYDVYREKREGGKASLRRAQWRLAATNSTMGIWLGKQYLDQHDERDLRLQGGEIGVKIVDDIPKQENKDNGSKAD